MKIPVTWLMSERSPSGRQKGENPKLGIKYETYMLGSKAKVLNVKA